MHEHIEIKYLSYLWEFDWYNVESLLYELLWFYR